MKENYQKSYEKYIKKREKAEQAYHLEGPYAHFIVHPKGIKQYKHELMEIFNMSSKQMKAITSESFHNILNTISDYPIVPRPYSNITHQIIKNSDQKINPYHVITEINEFMKKLDHLKQYGIQQQPINKNTIYLHNHDRYTHSLDTACNIELIMRRNGYEEREILKAIIAGCLHDLATPSFGDLTMKAFPELKEESSFLEYMAHYPELSKHIETTYDISLEEIHAWIKNEGIVGKILDVADRFAYTARDVFNVVGTVRPIEPYEDIYVKNIANVIKNNPTIFDSIMEISVENNQLVFENPEALEKILFLRANMHNLIYLNPYLWAREEHFGLVLQYLVKEGFLSLEQLQKGIYRDMEFINEEYLFRYIFENNIIDHDPMITYDFFDITDCSTKEEAIKAMQELKKSNGHMPVHYLKTPAFKPGTHYLIRDNEKIKPLADMMNPEKLKELHALSQATSKHLVLYPKENFHNNHKTHAKLYKFLCKKADEEYQKLLKS